MHRKSTLWNKKYFSKNIFTINLPFVTTIKIPKRYLKHPYFESIHIIAKSCIYIIDFMYTFVMLLCDKANDGFKAE